MYNQDKGGPIGLRGTCAIARFIMQIFDYKWEAVLNNVGLTLYLIARYMDEGRNFLPPVKPGWRWVHGKLLFCIRWEMEDKALSPSERRVLGESTNEILSFLDFTTESGEDYEDSWLPTLDSSLKVDKNNCVLFQFWEKPTNTNLVV